MIRAITFDLDGTLLDSAPSILAALADVLAREAIEPRVPLDFSLIGPPLQMILLHVTGFHQEDVRIPDLSDQFKVTYDGDFCCRAEPYFGIRRVLDQLKEVCPLMIATNKRDRPTRKILAHLSWSQFFDKVLCLDQGSPSFSSKAEMLEALLQQASIANSEMLYIGDRQEDLEAARSTGVLFAHAGWGYMDPAGKVLSGDDFYRLNHPNEILNLPGLSLSKCGGDL